MNKIIDTITGNMDEKRRYRDNEKRAKALPAPYASAYVSIRNYLWSTSGITNIDPLIALVDLLEETAAQGKTVTEVTGTDVAAFADELVRGEHTYKDKLRQKLNDSMNGTAKQ